METEVATTDTKKQWLGSKETKALIGWSDKSNGLTKLASEHRWKVKKDPENATRNLYRRVDVEGYVAERGPLRVTKPRKYTMKPKHKRPIVEMELMADLAPMEDTKPAALPARLAVLLVTPAQLTEVLRLV
jgi:hypothetical protein